MELDSYDTPNVLFLRGCFLKDCVSIEDIFDERIMGESAAKETDLLPEPIIYDKIPNTFVTMEAWIKKTNLKCWYCDCNFYNIPIFIPRYITDPPDAKSKHGPIGVHGNFCSWNCASYHINLYFPSNKWEKHRLLRFLYNIFTGKTIGEIVPSHPKTDMVQYGGKLTQTQYKEKLKKLIAIERPLWGMVS